MKKCFTLLALAFVTLVSCNKDEGMSSPALKEQTKRTVLAYLFQDTNLWDALAENINDMERGWDPSINGTMLVYVDPSTRLTQFDGKPVLLEIQHDTTNIIVSKIVKVYPDVNATNADVFLQVQQDAIAMFPAESYGLIMGGHANGFLVNYPDTKFISGSDRWNYKGIDVDVVAKNLATHYDFVIFDACLMGETVSLYQLRKGTDFVVASVEISPTAGFAYKSELKALYSQPKAELYLFAKGTRDFYQNTSKGKIEIEETGYFSIGVYRMAAMEKLAATTQKVLEKINLKYSDLQTKLMDIAADPAMGIENSMYYPRGQKYDGSSDYFDMGLLSLLLHNMDEKDLKLEFDRATMDVVLQKQFAFTDSFSSKNSRYEELSANLSFFIPNLQPWPWYKYQDNAFYNRFEWSAASGFTTKWE